LSVRVVLGVLLAGTLASMETNRTLEQVRILLQMKMSINRRKLRKNGNETLLFVGTRDAPSPHDAYLGSDKVGHPGEDGKCF